MPAADPMIEVVHRVADQTTVAASLVAVEEMATAEAMHQEVIAPVVVVVTSVVAEAILVVAEAALVAIS